MLLSYWDTYWDDNVIEEHYEVRTQLSEKKLTLPIESPGVEQEPSSITSVDDTTYHQNIFDYADDYFHFLLISMGDDLYGTSPGEYTMFPNNYSQLLNHYIYDYRGYTSNEVEIISTSFLVRAKTIELIKQGIPVKLSIGGHAVIAYDYDQKKDEIYCHFGWDSTRTHVTIESQGYTRYESLIALKFKNAHSHSDNYYYTQTDETEESICVCRNVIPDKIEIVGDYSLDTVPTFSWNSLIGGKWYDGLYHKLSILDSYSRVVYTKTHIYTNKYTLTKNEWKKALDIPGATYYIFIELDSDVDPYWDGYNYKQLFAEPSGYINKLQVKPSQWGFEGRYWFENEGIKTSTLALDGLTINTSRLRCGYIEDSYVILSPRRENAGKAYFEMNFDNPVYAFMYSVCLWSKTENLDGTAIIEVKDADGNWTQRVDILADNELLPRIEGLKRYIIQCPDGIYGIRFTATATATGTRNKGRLCIDDLVFCIDPTNTSFITTDYAKTHSTLS